MNCTKCKAPLASHFKVEHVSGAGTVTTSASLCSLMCLLGWGQDFAAHTGMRLVMGVQQKITSAKRTYDLLRGMFKGS